MGRLIVCPLRAINQRYLHALSPYIKPLQLETATHPLPRMHSIQPRKQHVAGMCSQGLASKHTLIS